MSRHAIYKLTYFRTNFKHINIFVAEDGSQMLFPNINSITLIVGRKKYGRTVYT